jgi:hypothetical protein
LPGVHLDAVNGRADRDIAHRQGIADADRRILSADDLGADDKPLRRHDVTALAIRVADQRDVGRTVRVVLQALHLGDDAVLVAPEIDDPVVALVAAALMAGGDPALVVAARSAHLLLDQRRRRACPCATAG